MSQAITLKHSQSLRAPRRRATDAGRSQLWRALYYFNLYRLVLGGAFLTLAWSGSQIAEYGNRSTTVFQIAATIFALISIVNLFTITQGRPGFAIQASAQTIVDIILITVMMYASNGVSSGLGLLLIVSVAGAGVVLPARATMFFAALASLCILVETTVATLMGHTTRYSYLQIGLLGAGIFMTGFIVTMLAGRIRESEQAITEARRDLQRQQKINDRIVQNLQSGVIVVDENNQVLLSNTESQRLLALDAVNHGQSLAKISPELNSVIGNWRASPMSTSLPTLKVSTTQIQPRIATLQQQDGETLVVYLDDQSKLDHQTQQHKLAALGRMSAAIAHEIRNPLSAVSHAGQLLAENPGVSDADKRLLDIIQQQTDRINAVVESVQQLGRRQQPDRHRFELMPWIQERISMACERHNLSHECISLTGFDSVAVANQGQMTQILDNLLDNAVTHGKSSTLPFVSIETGSNADGQAAVWVRDTGPGITPENVTHLFEPFFTTDSLGTGLGLYISRELGAANGVSLDYIANDGPGCCFQLVFSDEPAPGV